MNKFFKVLFLIVVVILVMFLGIYLGYKKMIKTNINIQDSQFHQAIEENEVIKENKITEENKEKTKLEEKEEIVDDTISKESLYSKISNKNYGDYINLGTNLKLTDVALEDGEMPLTNWRIFYKDTEKHVVYAILSDYLPYEYNNEFNIALGQYFTDGTHPYNWSTQGIYDKKGLMEEDYMIETLNDESNWKILLKNTEFAENDNIKVKGAIDIETWIKSWNEKGYSQIAVYKNKNSEYSFKNPKGEKEDLCDLATDLNGYSDTLYFPHKSPISENFGYWISNKSTGPVAYCVMNINFQGKISYNCSYDGSMSVRPIVEINSDVLAEATTKNGKNVWKLIK